MMGHTNGLVVVLVVANANNSSKTAMTSFEIVDEDHSLSKRPLEE